MISVVIPAFNAEETIERALESVLKQSYHHLEVIVVDDGSSDGTTEIVEFYVRRDQRVRLIRNRHAGPSSARNIGMREATGEWIAFLDADDEYAPGAFETVIARLHGLDVGLVIFSIEAVRAYIYAWPPALAQLEDRYFAGNGERADAFIREYFTKKQMLVYSQSNKLYRRSIIETHGLSFEENLAFGEDRLFNYRYLRHAGAVLTLSDRLLKYHYGRPGTLSSSATSGELSTLLALSEEKLNLFRDYGFEEAALEEFRRYEARQILDALVRGLIKQDRIGSVSKTRTFASRILEVQLASYFYDPEVAVSRRVRLMQHALKTRSTWILAVLTHLLRQSEDQRILKQRRGEISRQKELERLGLISARSAVRSRYYYLADYEYLLDRINHERHRNVLRDKAILLRRLEQSTVHDFLRREWLDLRRATLGEFQQFIEQNDRFVAKLFNGRWNEGTQIIDTRTMSVTIEQLYEQLVESKQFVVESFLEQHSEITRIYSGAVNTIRVHTLKLGNHVDIVLPTVFRFGSGGGTTSNTGSICSYLDLSEGAITTDGVRPGTNDLVSSEVLELHPDSGTKFQGAAVPFTIEVGLIVKESAKLVPEVPFIGWDVAITPDGPVIVEGNAASMILYSWQQFARRLMGKHGMRAELEEILHRFTRFERQQRNRRRSENEAK